MYSTCILYIHTCTCTSYTLTQLTCMCWAVFLKVHALYGIPIRWIAWQIHTCTCTCTCVHVHICTYVHIVHVHMYI